MPKKRRTTKTEPTPEELQEHDLGDYLTGNALEEYRKYLKEHERKLRQLEREASGGFNGC